MRAGAVLNLLGRVIAAIAGVIALIIAIAIVFHVLKANQQNGIVSLFDGLARFFVGPFDGIFKPKDPRAQIAVNWGIALVVYVVVGQLIARALGRLSPDP